MGKMGLSLNEEKTRVVDVWRERIRFLGFEIGIQRSGRTGKPYPLVVPSKKARQAIKTRLTALTTRQRVLVSPEVSAPKYKSCKMGDLEFDILSSYFLLYQSP